MVVAVRAVLVAILVFAHVFAKYLLALLTREYHLHRLLQSVCLFLGVAFGTVKPLFAAWRANGNLRIENVFTARLSARWFGSCD